MDGLDDIDRRLIALLRDDSRLPAVTLARRLGLSRATVQNRLDRLRATGVILNFTLRLRSDVESGRIRAITSIELRSAELSAAVQALKRMPEIASIHTTSGRWDLMVTLSADSLTHLDRVLWEIGAIKAISRSETSILLSDLK